MRRRVYPEQIAKNQMTQKIAAKQIAIMEAIAEDYRQNANQEQGSQNACYLMMSYSPQRQSGRHPRDGGRHRQGAYDPRWAKCERPEISEAPSEAPAIAKPKRKMGRPTIALPDQILTAVRQAAERT